MPGHDNDGGVVRQAALNRPNECIVERLQSGRVASVQSGVRTIPLHQAGKIQVTRRRIDEMLAIPFEHPNQEPLVERCIIQNNDTGRQDLQDGGWGYWYGVRLSIDGLEKGASTRLLGENQGAVRLVAVGLKTNHLGEQIPGLLEI